MAGCNAICTASLQNNALASMPLQVKRTQELFAKGTPPSQYTDRYELSIQG